MIVQHANTFAVDIETLRREKRMDYIDAVVFWCEQRNLDIEYAATLIKKDTIIKTKIQIEAEDLNALKKIKKSAQLPI
jgi:hypothetical protein